MAQYKSGDKLRNFSHGVAAQVALPARTVLTIPGSVAVRRIAPRRSLAPRSASPIPAGHAAADRDRHPATGHPAFGRGGAPGAAHRAVRWP